jgi:ankyrin repeat protein
VLGADVKVGTKDGATPIRVASEGGHFEVVKALASLGGEW